MIEPTWLWASAAVVFVLVVVDRAIARWWHRRTPDRSRPVPGGTGSVGIGAVFEVFSPGLAYLHAEQERQRDDLVEVGDADPPWDLDLDSGIVRINGAPARTARSAAERRERGLTAVAPGVWTITAPRWTTVTTVVVADDGGCLVIDPGITATEIANLAAEMTGRGWRPVAGFSTHPHWDHLLWSPALGDVPRWATPVAAQAAEQLRVQIVEQADAEAPGHDTALIGRLTPLPGEAGPTEVPWAGPPAVVVPYAGHCAGSAALVLTHSRVLVAGDMLSDVEIPLLDDTASDPVGDYREALDCLADAALQHRARWVIPGHGHRADRAELGRRLVADRAYLDALAAGLTVDDPRLADPEQATAHTRQQLLVDQLRTRGGPPLTSGSNR